MKKNIDLKTLFVTSSLFVGIALLTLFYYKSLPAQMAIHFDVHGKPNQFISKFLATVITPAVLFLLHIILCVSYDLKGITHIPIVRVVKWSVPIITCVIQVAQLIYNLGGHIDYRRLVVITLALGYIILGNYMPKDVERSSGSEKNRKVRRQTGYLFVMGGFFLLLSLFGPVESSILVLVLFGLVVIVWSMMHFLTGSKNSV